MANRSIDASISCNFSHFSQTLFICIYHVSTIAYLFCAGIVSLPRVFRPMGSSPQRFGVCMNSPCWVVYLFLEVISSVNRWTELDQPIQHFPHVLWHRMDSSNHTGLGACPMHTFEIRTSSSETYRAGLLFIFLEHITSEIPFYFVFREGFYESAVWVGCTLIFRPTSDSFLLKKWNIGICLTFFTGIICI